MSDARPQNARASTNIKEHQLVRVVGDSMAPAQPGETPNGYAMRDGNAGRYQAYMPLIAGQTHAGLLSMNCQPDDALHLDTDGTLSPGGAGAIMGRACSAGFANGRIEFVYEINATGGGSGSGLNTSQVSALIAEAESDRLRVRESLNTAGSPPTSQEWTGHTENDVMVLHYVEGAVIRRRELWKSNGIGWGLLAIDELTNAKFRGRLVLGAGAVPFLPNEQSGDHNQGAPLDVGDYWYVVDNSRLLDNQGQKIDIPAGRLLIIVDTAINDIFDYRVAGGDGDDEFSDATFVINRLSTDPDVVTLSASALLSAIRADGYPTSTVKPGDNLIITYTDTSETRFYELDTDSEAVFKTVQSGGNITTRQPESLQINSHGISSILEPIPVVVIADPESPSVGQYAIATTNEQAEEAFMGYAVAVIDGDNVQFIPAAWASSLGERTVVGAAMSPKQDYWLQPNGRFAPGIPNTGDLVRGWRSNSANTYDFHPDVIVTSGEINLIGAAETEQTVPHTDIGGNHQFDYAKGAYVRVTGVVATDFTLLEPTGMSLGDMMVVSFDVAQTSNVGYGANVRTGNSEPDLSAGPVHLHFKRVANGKTILVGTNETDWN